MCPVAAAGPLELQTETDHGPGSPPAGGWTVGFQAVLADRRSRLARVVRPGFVVTSGRSRGALRQETAESCQLPVLAKSVRLPDT